MPTEAKQKELRVVVDTNVIVSALHFGGKPEQILYLASGGSVRLFLSPLILKETYGVLVYKLSWAKSQAQKVIDTLSNIAMIIVPRSEITLVREHHADNNVLACAVDANAHYLITGDKKHLLPLKRVNGARVVSPEEFLAIWKRL